MTKNDKEKEYMEKLIKKDLTPEEMELVAGDGNNWAYWNNQVKTTSGWNKWYSQKMLDIQNGKGNQNFIKQYGNAIRKRTAETPGRETQYDHLRLRFLLPLP